MKIEKLFERAKDIKNLELRMEYLRIVGTRAMAERHFEALRSFYENNKQSFDLE